MPKEPPGFQSPSVKEHCDLQTDQDLPLHSARSDFEHLALRQWHKVCAWNVMKKALLLVVILAAGMFAPGCKKSGENATGTSQSNLVYNYTFDKKEVFIDDARADLTELDQRINEFSEKVATASATVKAAAQPKIDDLRKQRVALGKKLETLKTAKEVDWNELKADYQKAGSQMRLSLHDSWKWVQDNTGS